jgi:hypothetical protein
LPYGVGDRICLFLIAVAGAPDAILEVHSRALLHNMRRFVRGELDIGVAAESDAVTRCISQRTHTFVGMRRGAADRGPCTSDVVAAEQSLDAVNVRKRLAGARDAFACGTVQPDRRILVVILA